MGQLALRHKFTKPFLIVFLWRYVGRHQHPTACGDYPETMKKSVGDRLPSFTPEQSKKLIGSCDYVGINYYSSLFVKSIKHVDPTQPTWRTDQGVDWMSMSFFGDYDL